jgi:hypothetical protein
MQALFCFYITQFLPREVRMCLSSALVMKPFCSLSKTRKPSTKSSRGGTLRFLLMVCRMGKNVSNEIRASATQALSLTWVWIWISCWTHFYQVNYAQPIPTYILSLKTTEKSK